MPPHDLRFANHLVSPIKLGKKDTTIRYGLDTTIRNGDRLRLRDASGDQFGMATVTGVGTAPIEAILDIVDEMNGTHGREAVDPLFEALRTHYPDADLTLDTEVTAIRFDPDEAALVTHDPRLQGPSETGFEVCRRLYRWGPSRPDWEREEQYGP